MIHNLPYDVQMKYAHIFDEHEEMHRVATANNQYFLQGFPTYAISGVWDRFGFINTVGKEVVPPQYSWANDFSDGLAFVETTDAKKYFIDKNGKIKINLAKYDKVYSFSEGLSCVMSQGKYGFIDLNGNEVIPLVFDYVIGFYEFRFNSNGIVGVALDDKYGIIDRTGKYVHQPNYDLLRYNWSNPEDPYITLYKEGRQIFLNEKGEAIEER